MHDRLKMISRFQAHLSIYVCAGAARKITALLYQRNRIPGKVASGIIKFETRQTPLHLCTITRRGFTFAVSRGTEVVMYGWMYIRHVLLSMYAR